MSGDIGGSRGPYGHGPVEVLEANETTASVPRRLPTILALQWGIVFSRRLHLSGQKGYWSQVAFVLSSITLLCQCGTYAVFRGIGVQMVRAVWDDGAEVRSS